MPGGLQASLLPLILRAACAPGSTLPPLRSFPGRAGWITNFLSHAQVSGFMTGAAILIGMSQASRRVRRRWPSAQAALLCPAHRWQPQIPGSLRAATQPARTAV